MKAKLILFAVLIVAITGQQNWGQKRQYQNTQLEDYLKNWSSKKQQVKSNTSTVKNSHNHNHNNSYQKKNLKNRLTKKHLWKIFDYMNQGVTVRDKKCYNTPKTGCCIRGRFYEEEKCWIAILSMAVFSTAVLVCILFCFIAIFFVGCCVCIRRCKRQKIIKMLKKKKAAEANKVNNSINTTNSNATNTSVISTSSATSAVTTNKKPVCNCPKKKIQQNLPVNDLRTTTNDFGYQPPKLQIPLKPVVPQKSVELHKGEEVEVKNPYPKFETIMKSNIFNKFVGEAIKVVAQPQPPKKVCTCKRAQVSSNVYDINNY